MSILVNCVNLCQLVSIFENWVKLCHFVSTCVTLCQFVSIGVNLYHFVSLFKNCVNLCNLGLFDLSKHIKGKILILFDTYRISY